MQYLAFASLDGFYVDELRRQRPDLADRPLLIVKDGTILDACSACRERGVSGGQQEKIARALVEGVVVEPWKESLYVEASRAWLDRLTPFSNVIEPVGQHTAYIDLSSHPDPHSILLVMAVALGNLPSRVYIGVGTSKWLARLAVMHPISTMEIDRPDEYLKPLPIALLYPVSMESRKRLKFLGYSTIGDVQEVPLDVLRKQFPGEATTIYEACRGGCYAPVLPLYPEASLRSEFRFEGAVDTTDALDRAIEVLAGELAVQLSLADGQGQELELFIETEERGTWMRERSFAKPLYSRLTVHTALKLLLKEPIEDPVLSLRAVMPRVAKQLGTQPGMGLAKDEARKFNEQSVERLGKTFGDRAIVRASTLGLPWHKRFIQEWARSLGHG